MIIGIGNDLCNIERIQGSLDRFGEKFEKRCFTEGEIARLAPKRSAQVSHAAACTGK